MRSLQGPAHERPKASKDTPLDFLLPAAAADFHAQHPSHTINFRKVHMGHVMTPGGESSTCCAVSVLKKFIDQLSPLSWTGSRATIIENDAKPLDKLENYPDAAVRQFVSTIKSRLSEAVTAKRGSEAILEREIQDWFEWRRVPHPTVFRVRVFVPRIAQLYQKSSTVRCIPL
jgi:hypothetical protein